MLCHAQGNIAGEKYQRRETVVRQEEVDPASSSLTAMCASYVYKRRKLLNSVNNSSKINGCQTTSGSEVSKCQINISEINGCQMDRSDADKHQINSSEVNDCQINRSEVNKCQINRSDVSECQVRRSDVSKCQIGRSEVNECQVSGSDVNFILSPDPEQINALKVEVNGSPQTIDQPLIALEKDHLRMKIPACRDQKLTLSGCSLVDFSSASSSDQCDSSSGVHLLLGSPYSTLYMRCKKCGNKGNQLRMLICDLCDEAFHFSCSKARRIPDDEWYCRPCLRKKPKVLPETLSGQLFYIMKQKRQSKIMREKLGPIMSMLVEDNCYTSGVRMGDRYQVDVPEWSGPVSDGDNYLDKATELGPAEWWSLNTLSSGRIQSTGNWVQCKAMVYNEADENDEGSPCGRWRRAPLFVAQTEDWDCSCALTWDPVHADCAVPQELETSGVLEQLKYVQLQLKRRLEVNENKQ